eukprot:m.235162 g.235162  ORF g.235162 m.235162 type:complete len:112 (+) comp19332_c0_seq5:361-696(+)
MVQHRVCTGRTTLSLSWLRIACHDTDAWFEDVIPRIQEHAALLQRLLQPTHASSSVPATDNSAILRSPVDEKQCTADGHRSASTPVRNAHVAGADAWDAVITHCITAFAPQ